MTVCNRRISIRRCAVPVVAVLGCALLASLGSAKMINADEIERDSTVSVAEWHVDVSSTSDESIVLDAGGTGQTYELTVTNGSAVASSYTIKVANIPDGVKLGLDVVSDSDLVAPVGGEVVFTDTGGDLGYVTPNNMRLHVLTLVAESTADITQDGVDLAIDVQFVQKEPGVL